MIICEMSDCTRQAEVRGYCRPHYLTARRRGLIERTAISHTLSDDGHGGYVCTACGPTALDINGRCLEGVRKRSRRHQAKRDRHGLTRAQLDALAASQGGVCAVCGAGGALVVDHDHACCPVGESCGACVRGLLCVGCNTGIGKLGDNAAGVRAALAFLEAYESRP